MNAQEYISSGAIEACIMGLATDEDWQELDRMVLAYPEVRMAKEAFEKELEKIHLAEAHEPPSFLKQKIMQSLTFNKGDEARVVALADAAPAAPGTKPLVVPLVPVPKPVKWLQRALAASVIFLMGSILLNFVFYSKSVEHQQQYDQATEKYNALAIEQAKLQDCLKMVTAPEVKQVPLPATSSKPGSLATVFWNRQNKEVHLMVQNLPAPAPGKQYQLWALVDGKPVDAGMVPLATEDMVLKMHKMQTAEAFAITLEKEGGSREPSMEEMYVYGGVLESATSK